jgi:hypothetical protein
MPGDELQRWLVDRAARSFDGVPLFPHPLTPLTKTWLGSTEVEGTLSRSLRQAMVRFGDLAKTQGAAQEEHLTGALLVELEVAFRNTSMRLESGPSPRLARIISVSQRPVLKAEEKRWGCDIALLLKADLQPSVVLRLAELVQVKKSEAFAAPSSPSPDEKWRIDVPQLVTLLEMSESSSYWLILSTGELLCVTARWLHGLAQGPLIASSAKPTISRAGGERFSSRAAWCRTPERQGRRWRAAGLVDVARGRRRRDVGSALPMASRPQSIGIPDHRGAGRRRRPPPGRARARRRDLNGLAASVARTVAGLVASAAEDLGRIRRPVGLSGWGDP